MSYQQHKELQKKINRLEKSVKATEEKIAKLEKRKNELDTLLMNAENASNMELVTEYTSLQQQLDKENNFWFEQSEKLASLQGKE